MHRADKAVLRLAIGLGLAVLISYGLALQMPFAVCVLAVLMLCSPAPPMPLLKAAAVALFLGCVVVAGILMVPVLEHYPVPGVLLTAALLYAVFFAGAHTASPFPTFVVIALTCIPAVGVYEQAIAVALAQAVGTGLGVGAVVNSVSHTFFPDAPEATQTASPPTSAEVESARWHALRATVVVMPIFIVALTNPAAYISTVMKAVALGKQTGEIEARSAGRELVGSTLMGGLIAVLIWAGLSLLPNLWMLVLWIVAAAFWVGARLFRVKPSPFTPSFWRNVLMTVFLLLGPAIEDASIGNDPYAASALRVTLFIVLAFYAWAAVWVLERWRLSRALSLFSGHLRP